MKECKHKNVIHSIKYLYYFPNGYKKDVEENPDCDMSEFETEIIDWNFCCQDCGEILDEQA